MRFLLIFIMMLNLSKFNGLHRLRARYNLISHYSSSSSIPSSSSSSIPSAASPSASPSAASATEEEGSKKTINAWDNWEYGTFNTKLVKANTEQDVAIKEFINNNTNTINTGKLYDIFQKMNETDLNKGINALQQFTLSERLTRFHAVLDQRTDNIRMVYENPANANNIWASLRTLDTFGIQYADIIAKRDEYKTEWRRDTMTSAMGSQKWLTLAQYENTTDCINRLKQNGYKIVSTDLHNNSKSIHDYDWNQGKIAIVIGNEDKGVSDEVRRLSDDSIVIPMKGFSESLNLSVAVAVLCSVLQTKGILSPNLDELTKKRILLTWLTKTVNGATTVLRCSGLSIKSDQLWDTLLGFTTKP